MLELSGVEKRVGGEVHLADITMRLEPGTLNVLLGPTLSGKTSLMRLMAGLDKPTAGTICENGADVTGLPVQKRNVAFVYQQFINYPALTVYENIASPLRIARKGRKEIEATVTRVAELLKLTPYLKRLPLQLSGGQQQRTALARALAKDARLVLLDEPLANLDYKLREELRAELPRIFAASGAIFVYATAEPEEALLLGGNTATMDRGRVTQFGPTTAVYRRPETLATARTFSDPPLNTAEARKAGDRFIPRAPGAGMHPNGPPDELAPIPVPPAFRHLPDGVYTIAIRPHHLQLAPAEASVEGVVDAVEITGSETFVHTRSINDWSMLTHGVHRYERGTPITLSFDLRHLMVFEMDGRAVEGLREREAA
jgi:glycerol transport system ATP-binding protein